MYCDEAQPTAEQSPGCDNKVTLTERNGRVLKYYNPRVALMVVNPPHHHHQLKFAPPSLYELRATCYELHAKSYKLRVTS